MRKRISPGEEKEVRDQLRNAQPPKCPGCGEPLSAIPILPRSDVSYVRNRILLNCGSCGLRMALDEP